MLEHVREPLLIHFRSCSDHWQCYPHPRRYADIRKLWVHKSDVLNGRPPMKIDFWITLYPSTRLSACMLGIA